MRQVHEAYNLHTSGSGRLQNVMAIFLRETPPPPSLTELGLRIVDDVSDSQRFLWILYGARYRYTRLLVDHYDMIS